jgi:hypothetical protein
MAYLLWLPRLIQEIFFGTYDIQLRFWSTPSRKIGYMEIGFTERIDAAAMLINSLLIDFDAASTSTEDVVAVRRLIDRTELLCTAMVARVNQDGIHTDDGYRTVGDWLTANTGVRKSEGTRRLSQAALLSQLPVFGAAVMTGATTIDHVNIVAVAVTPERLALAVRDEQLITTFATEQAAPQFAVLMRKWMSCADDALGDPSNHDQQYDRRRLQLTQQHNGMWNLNALLDTLSGETLHAAITAALPKLTKDETRTLSQLRHDALTDIATESLASADRQDVGNERPNVNLIIHVEDGSAHTPNMVYLSSFARDMVLCDATSTPIKVNSLTGQPFDVGTPQSAIPVRNRKAVLTRDRCCRIGGCNRAPRWCQIHHIQEREHGGTHELANLVLVCTYHHQKIHRQGLVLNWHTDGITLLTSLPGGKTLHGPPHPATRNLFHTTPAAA